MNETPKTHEDFLDALAPIAEGDEQAVAAFLDHLAENDEARDLRYDAEGLVVQLKDAGADYVEPPSFVADLLAAVDADGEANAPAASAAPVAATAANVKAPSAPEPAPVPAPTRGTAPSKGRLILLAGGGALLLAAAAAALLVARSESPDEPNAVTPLASTYELTGTLDTLQ
ncbi:MAG: hypothetical protein AAF411_20775, partial [Myxococcota bacterium]